MVAVVKDGVNDGPALAAGYISMAVMFNSTHLVRAESSIAISPPIRPTPWSARGIQVWGVDADQPQSLMGWGKWTSQPICIRCR
jgi:hypothetical protein